jgi:hypothetical protein
MTVTVTPAVEAAAGGLPPRVRLNIAATGGLASVTVTRLDPDGRIYPVRTATGDPLPMTGGAGLLYDYEAPFGQAVFYSSLEDTATVTGSVTVSETRVWLVHPGVPALSTPIELGVGSASEEEWSVQQGVFWAMGRETPLVFTDGGRKAPSSSLSVLTDTATDFQALKSILSDASPLLLNVPTTLGLGLDTDYISIGAVHPRRPSDIGTDTLRVLELPYMVVNRPAGGSQATRTWTDVKITYNTWTDVKAAYPTWFALLTGP